MNPTQPTYMAQPQPVMISPQPTPQQPLISGQAPMISTPPQMVANHQPQPQPISGTQPMISGQPIISAQPSLISPQFNPVPQIISAPAPQAPQPQPVTVHPVTKPKAVYKMPEPLKRHVIALEPEMQNHLLPNALTLQTSKYLKRTTCYLYRGRQSGARIQLAHAIFAESVNLVKLASELNKRPNNLTLIYELDGLHAALRVMWFTYYDSGFLGDFKNKGKIYNSCEALRLFRLINEPLDAIGRMIGAAKAKAQDAKRGTGR